MERYCMAVVFAPVVATGFAGLTMAWLGWL
jgi:hypothetical protein